ncbi:MAG: RNA methyltransferase, partial [Treponema sp.]|nr:RNA methyltransferase [Treponema sp.]
NKRNNELAVCGLSTVKKLEKHNWKQIRRLYFTKDVTPLFGGLCKRLAENHGIYNEVEESELEKLSGTVHHQGVVAMIYTPEITPLSSDITDEWVAKHEVALILDNIGNANNFGAIVRSAAFFGIENIILTNSEPNSLISTSSYRIAEGGMEFVKIFSVVSLERLLKATSGQFVRIGTDLKATLPLSNISNLCKKKATFIIIGNEETGLSKKTLSLCDYSVIIPFMGMQEGKKPCVQSLNVAQATSIILYEISKHT